MIFDYGGYNVNGRPVKLTSVRKEPQRSARGEIIAMRHQWQVEGELLSTDQEELTELIEAAEAAFVDGKSATLYLLDGTTPSAHALDHDSSIAGVRVASFAWTDATSVEYATRRSFELNLFADYDPAVVPVYVEYEDSFESNGNGGARVEWDERITGAPVSHQTAAVTLRRGRRSGRAIGLTSRPNAPSPFEFPGLVSSTRGVVKFGPVTVDGRLTNYGIAWNYEYRGNVDYIDAEPSYAPPLDPEES